MRTWRTGSRADGLAGMKATQSAMTSAHSMICAPRRTPVSGVPATRRPPCAHTVDHAPRRSINVQPTTARDHEQALPNSSLPRPMLHMLHGNAHRCTAVASYCKDCSSCQLKRPPAAHLACALLAGNGMTLLELCGYQSEQGNGQTRVVARPRRARLHRQEALVREEEGRAAGRAHIPQDGDRNDHHRERRDRPARLPQAPSQERSAGCSRASSGAVRRPDASYQERRAAQAIS